MSEIMSFPGSSVVENLPAMQKPQEMQVWSLDWDNPLEEEMATYSSNFTWRIWIMDRGAWWATVHGVTKSQT